ncbi:MAG TPA: Gfo/Idh/MocA family oxidoreductase [Candidatus Paenibacillus intestinavium]|nr:Gfo/Idh/MocA family oxidoreductase [Candidatus Paenibacillus intestinavium]
MKPITAILLGAGGRGRFAYGAYASRYPEQLKIVAIAEPDEERRSIAAHEHGLDLGQLFESWEDVFNSGKIADVVIVATQDRMHFEPVMKAMKLGYDVLLEKPMSPEAEEVIAMANAAEFYQRKLIVSHVLRYTPFWSKVKQLIAGEQIGDIVTLQLSENVGYYHMAHSFVRGNWNKSEITSPMILQKSCHDMDIISWLMDKKCTKINSYGSLSHFKSQNAPVGSTARCTDGCAVERECPYSAKKIYGEDKTGEWAKFITGIITPESVQQALEQGPFGRCVYQCDNDVVDHQVVNMEFENYATASFTMSGFTHDISRVIQIMGTHGEIRGYMEKNELVLYRFGKEPETIVIPHIEGGHSGGDTRLMDEFVRNIREERVQKTAGLTSAVASVQSHLMAIAAERSRLIGGNTVELSKWQVEGGIT